MKKILWLDLETFSEKPIKYGTHSYAETVEIMLFAWAINNSSVNVWDITDKSPMPAELKQALTDPDTVIFAHNSHFDRTMLNHAGIKTNVRRWRDTMVQALAHGLPGALAALCEVLGVPTDKAKDKEGKALIQLFCKPRPKNSALRRATGKTHPEEWKRFSAYAGLDIEAMREVHKRLPAWNYRDEELAHWHRDQEINDRGVCMDVRLASAAIEAVEQEQKRLARLTQELTDNEVQAATQRDALLQHISSAFGVDLPDMQKSTLERRISDPDIPLPLRELLAIRLQASTTSTSKYKALMNGVSADGRLRGTLQFCGASRTGRWAGHLFQPQNLPRPTLDQETIDNGIEALKAGCADLIYDDIMQLTSSALRGCIMAPEGKKLVVSDLSNIEGRVLAWLAGESWKIKAFSEFDNGIGADLYKLAYAKPYNMEPDLVDKEQRQIGKVMELACLHGDTLVLTNHGYIKLINIKNNDLLWDGVEWVKHNGLISKGLKKVMSIAGVQMTPNHQVLTPHGWKPASLIDSNKNTLARSLELASESLPWSVKAKKSEESEESTCNARVEHLSTVSLYQTCLRAKVPDVISALKKQQKPIVNNIFATLMLLKMTKLEHVCSIVSPPQCHVVTIPTINYTETTEGAVYKSARNGNRIKEVFSAMLKIWAELTTPILKWIASITIKGTSRETSGLYQKPTITGIKERYQKCNNELMNWSNVYDIVSAGPRNRFTIKTNTGHLIVHNCGYGGGVAAFLTFALTYGLDLDELADAALPNIPPKVKHDALSWYQKSVETKKTYGLSEKVFITCDSLKRMWRNAHPETVSFWYELEDTVRRAIASPGTTFPCHRLKVRRDKAWLRIVLPSGRAVCYPSPRVDNGQISYMGVNPYSRKWQRLKTYGGKLVENVTQAAARDVLAGNMPVIENHGYAIVLTVHDEVLTEAPDSTDFSHEQLSALLATNPPWAPDLPLSAGGFEAYHYRKD
ncbi:hypothetical protein CKG00_10795 [Morganella morganii]|uniref:DNA-directed DNA polymerase n=1 Tax=Morganella morganii TaxID=582 RepID=A0A433ZXJ2_MORMO|nr:DNA polymerase [Morganella morganii]RUT66819.1 hypothetical protein CKG00_10795 [Morganella morganii]